MASSQNAWDESLKSMARTADPSFEVATIKPSDPNDHNQGFHLNDRQIHVENNTMTSILCFAYSIQKSQIVNAPKWFDDQRWDIKGVPDVAGVPNWNQYKGMLRKLLAERVGLQVHHEKREMPVYVLSVLKGGPKFGKSKSAPDALSDQSGHGMGASQYMKYTNSSMADFAMTLQLMGGDRPVLDQTNLPDRYDFSLTWTPNILRATEPDPAPVLFTAIQEQLGLKMEATRTQADVLVIDAATEPTQN